MVREESFLLFATKEKRDDEKRDCFLSSLQIKRRKLISENFGNKSFSLSCVFSTFVYPHGILCTIWQNKERKKSPKL